MEKQNKKNKNTEPKRFSYTFTPVMLVLIIGVLLLCSAGIAVSIWRIVQFGIKGFNDVIKYPFLIAVCVFCIVLMISLLIKSQYIVDDKHFTTQYGFVKSRFLIKDVTSIVYNTDTKKLTLKFAEEFATFTVNPDWNEQLVRALLAVNPNIDYSFTLTDVPQNKK